MVMSQLTEYPIIQINTVSLTELHILVELNSGVTGVTLNVLELFSGITQLDVSLKVVTVAHMLI
jgi:hypothetical protein